jgi:hypothetical protein
MKFKTTQWVAIAGCILLVVAIYLFADTKKPAASKPEGPMASRDVKKDDTEAPAFDWDGYMQKVKGAIGSKDTLAIISGLEKGGSPSDLRSLINIYHNRGESIAEAYYTLQLGQQTKDSLLTRAGDLFAATAAISTDDALHKYLLDESVESYKDAALQDSSVSTQMKLASAYMDQGTAPMQGVGILLGIVTKDPNNADAQFLLGKFGIVSRQFDKAIVRLEKVVSLRPQNYDAVFLLAVAYSGKGDNAKAITLLDKCSKMVTKPELKQKIEEYKKSLSKGQ